MWGSLYVLACCASYFFKKFFPRTAANQQGEAQDLRLTLRISVKRDCPSAQAHLDTDRDAAHAQRRWSRKRRNKEKVSNQSLLDLY